LVHLPGWDVPNCATSAGALEEVVVGFFDHRTFIDSVANMGRWNAQPIGRE
jgi:hypothetical protein